MDDTPLVIEALQAYAAIAEAEAVLEHNALAAELHREQVQRSGALAAELLEALRRG